MPPWRTPEAEARFDAKFIRVGSDIFVGNSIHDGHQDIEIMDGLEARIQRLRITTPIEVDAGVVSVKPSGIISVTGEFGSLQLPVYEVFGEARDATVEKV